MKNEDMPANPQSFAMTGMDTECGTMLTHYYIEEAIENMGETKFEKAYWQVYSAILVGRKGDVARMALEATKEGFKALESLKRSK